MNKAIIDTCFFEQFNKKSSFAEKDFCTLINGAELELLIHPYVFENELSVFSYIQRLLSIGVCTVVEYDDFLINEYYKRLYIGYFIDIYNKFYERIKISKPWKIAKMIQLDSNSDIFKMRRSGASLGDVHIILMAMFMDVPLILSEDSDMMDIYNIAKRSITRDDYELTVYKVDGVINLAKEIGQISGKEIKRMRRAYN